MSVFQELNGQGITIILVTHERDLAHYARRIVEMRDGHVRMDVRIESPGNAAEDFAEFRNGDSAYNSEQMQE